MARKNKAIKSIRRGERWIILLLVLFGCGMGALVFRIVNQSSFYMSHSTNVLPGMVYDSTGDVLYDPEASTEKYSADQFLDVGNLIGDDSGQMTNTLVSENLADLQNYSLIFGATTEGNTAIYTTLNHKANQAVYNAFGSKNGTAIAYNYETGEILVCVSKPCVNILDGYDNIDSLEEGSLICKAFYETVPGSTQKICTTAAALEEYGMEELSNLSYDCSGTYATVYNQEIHCHNLDGHGTQNIQQGFENSCNPFFAQLVENLPLQRIISTYRNMGIAVNDDKATKLEIDGINVFTASTKLTDVQDFDTMWSCMGQSDTLVSPCQMMLWESAIANGTGKVTNAHLIDYETGVTGMTKYKAKTSYGDSIFSATIATDLQQIMLQNGADKYNSDIGHTVGVKSGTAQINNGETENSLLTGFCAEEDLPIAFAVVIEDRVSGEVSTSNIVSTLLNALSEAE